MNSQSSERGVITITTTKKQKQSLYKFGVEIECMVPYERHDDFTNEMEMISVDCGTDGSIDEKMDHTGVELRTPPLPLYAMVKLLKQINKICTKYEVRVNESCGVHVHASNRKFFKVRNLRKIVGLWVALEDVMFATQPSSRFNNSYCKRKLRQHVIDGFPKLPAEKQKMVSELGYLDRYFALNLASLARHGTIECRLHAGSINADKIINWIKLLRAFYNYAINRYDAKEVTEVFRMGTSWEKINKSWELLRLDDEMKAHFNARINKFVLPKLDKQQRLAFEVMKLKPARDKAWREYDEKMKIASTAQQELRELSQKQDDLLREFGNY